MFEIANAVAVFIGWIIMLAGGLMLMLVVAYFPCNYAWKKFGDIQAFLRVIKEAEKQGVKLWR